MNRPLLESEIDLLTMSGCKLQTRGSEIVIDAGFIANANLELFTDESDDGINIDGNYVDLAAFSKLANGGKHFRRGWQLTGSCVRFGLYHALTNRAGVEIGLLPQPERFAEVDTWLAYASSRSRLGDNGPGEGSSGDYIAQEAGRVGVIPTDDPNAAKYVDCGSVLVYDREAELAGSSIRSYPDAYLQDAKKFTVNRQSVTTADQAEAELRKGRPLTWAGMWGGLMECPVEEGLLLSRHASQWNHQQSCDAIWRHKKLGRIFRIQNNWFMIDPAGGGQVEYGGSRFSRYVNRVSKAGPCLSVHAPAGFVPQFGEPPGTYWIKEADMDWQCRSGEVRSFSGFKGFRGPVSV